MVNIKKFIRENSDISYADFNKKYISTKYSIKGVRIPLLRKFAKTIEPEYVELESNPSHEEILLYGFAAGNFKSETEQLEYLQNVLPYIDNWGTCDCIVPSLKKLTGEKTYQFFTQLLKSPKEFYVRVGLIGLMRFFLKTEKIGEILQNIQNITCDEYYVKMAVAWLYAELATFNFPLAKNAIEKTSNKFVRNKAISKARESYRLTPEQKQELLSLKI